MQVLVRKEAFQRLAEVYKAYATKCYDGLTAIDKQLEWIPGKLLRCCYDKDVKEFRYHFTSLRVTSCIIECQWTIQKRTENL